MNPQLDGQPKSKSEETMNDPGNDKKRIEDNKCIGEEVDSKKSVFGAILMRRR